MNVLNFSNFACFLATSPRALAKSMVINSMGLALAETQYMCQGKTYQFPLVHEALIGLVTNHIQPLLVGSCVGCDPSFAVLASGGRGGFFVLLNVKTS